MANMLIFVQIIRTHDGPCVTFLNSCLKSRQIDFVQSTVIYYHICSVAIHFLVIQRIMLHTGSHSILLYSLYIRNNHTPSQIRIFAHIFKITPIQRCTIDIHTRSQQNGFITIASFFSDTFSVEHRHCRIPGSSQTS